MKPKTLIALAGATVGVGALASLVWREYRRAEPRTARGTLSQIGADITAVARSCTSVGKRIGAACQAGLMEWKRGEAVHPEPTDRVDEEFAASRTSLKPTDGKAVFPQHN